MQKLRVTISLISILTFIVSNFAHAQANKCPSGQFWDSRVNRCMITMNNAQVKQESAACAGMSGDAFKECFNQNAANRVSEQEESGEMQTHEKEFTRGNGAKIAVPLTMTLITAYYLFLNKDKFKHCKSTSLYLLFGAGAVSLIGEASAQITYKNKTKNLADEYKDKMEDYKREKKYDIMTKNQTMAFDYLIEAEKARISAEKIRKGTYTLASLMYASTVAMALVESVQTGFAYGGGCTANAKNSTDSKPGDDGSNQDKTKNDDKNRIENKNDNKNQTGSLTKKHYDKLVVFNKEFSGYEHMESMTTLEFMEILARKIYANVTISSAHAITIEMCADQGMDLVDGKCVPKNLPKNTTTDDPKKDDEKNILGKAWDGTKNVAGKVGGGIKDGANWFTDKIKSLGNTGAGKKQYGFIDKAIATPYVRGALATVLGLYANKLRKDAKDNIEVSENRIGILEKMRDDFVASGGAGLQMCTESDRLNKDKPHCFCYTEDGNFDKRKSKLTICANLKKEFDMRMAKKYGWTHGEMAAVKVCVDEKNQMDTFCKCKSKKSSKGKGNSCAKVSSSMNLSGLGGNSWLKGVVSPADSLFNGNLDGSQLDTASLNKKAMALNRKIAKMSKDPKYKSNFDKMKKNGLKLQNAHKAWFKKSFGNSMPKGLASIGAGAATSPTSIKDVMKEATKSLEKSKGVKYGTAGGSEATGGKKNNNLDFDWGSDGAGEGGVKVEEIAKVMDKNYSIKGDINKNPNHDIFKILSNRYQRSGLRRLFDVDGTSKADEADGSDINEK